MSSIAPLSEGLSGWLTLPGTTATIRAANIISVARFKGTNYDEVTKRAKVEMKTVAHGRLMRWLTGRDSYEVDVSMPIYRKPSVKIHMINDFWSQEFDTVAEADEYQSKVLQLILENS